MEAMDTESVKHVSLGVLRDLWKMRWGDSYVAISKDDAFWFEAAVRLYHANWCSRTRTHPDRYVFKLKEPVT